MPAMDVQGLLDLSVEMSTSDVTAGKAFALFVRVRNPFSYPIRITQVHVSLPSELEIGDPALIKAEAAYDKQQKIDEAERQRRLRAGLDSEIDHLETRLSRMKLDNMSEAERDRFFDDVVRDVRQSVEKAVSGNVALAVFGARIKDMKIASNASVALHNDEGRQTEVERLQLIDPLNFRDSARMERIVKLHSSLPEEAALQPGCTAIYTAVLNVKRSLVFTPSKYRLQFNVNYVIADATGDAAIFSSNVAHDLQIRPSVLSVITGSCLGGLFGSLARLLQNFGAPQGSLEGWPVAGIVSVLLAVILSAVAVIFLARKSDAQSFVTVEDFWGGILIGFFVGYTGSSFFGKLTGVLPG